MKKMKEIIDKIGLFRVIMIIIGIVMIIGLFLPYEKAIGSNREHLTKYKNEYFYTKDFYMTNEDALDFTLIENYKTYSYVLNNDEFESLHDIALTNKILYIALFVSIAIVILFSLLGINVMVIISSLVMGGSELLINLDAFLRDVLPSSNYTPGMSYYLFVVSALILIILSIIAIILKKKNIKFVNNKKIKSSSKKTTNKTNSKSKIENKKNDKKTVKLDKKNSIIIIAIIAVIFVFVIGIIIGNKLNNKNDSNSNKTNNSNSSNVLPGTTIDDNNVIGNTYDELKKNSEASIDSIITELRSEWNSIMDGITTIDDYKNNTSAIDEYLEKVESKTDLICTLIKKYTLKYAELIYSNDGNDLDEMYDDFDKIYDNVYNGLVDKIYDDIYNDILDNYYDDIYDGVVSDSYYELSYKEYSSLSTSSYRKYSDVQTSIYRKYSDLQTVIYRFYSDLQSKAYSGSGSGVKNVIDEFEGDIV